MKKNLTILTIFIAMISISAPVQSMLGARNCINSDSGKDFPYPLPEGVVAIKYLQGDGASGILIPWNIREQYGTLSLAYYNTDTTKSSPILGQRLLTGANAQSLYFQHSRNSGRLFRQACSFYVTPYNQYSVWFSSSSEGAQLDKLFTFSLNIATKIATWWDGSESTLTEKEFPASSNLGVFGLANKDGNGFYSYGVIRLLYFRIEQDGAFVYNLIPVRFLNEDKIWEGAMYDLVSSQLFRNQGTGSFIIGPDL